MTARVEGEVRDHRKVSLLSPVGVRVELASVGVHASGKARVYLKAKGLCLIFLGAPEILQNPEIQFFPYAVGKEEE